MPGFLFAHSVLVPLGNAEQSMDVWEPAFK